jgi:hypothetical protein
MITKDDIARIVKIVQSMSVKDSSFPLMTSVIQGDDVRIPVLSNSKNRLMKLESLAKYVNSNVELSSLPIDVAWSDKKTFGAVLNDLYEIVKSKKVNGGDGEVVDLIAANVDYTKVGTDYLTVKDALDSIIDTLDRIGNIDDEVDSLKDTLDGTATLDKHIQMLDMSQWPRNVIKSITPGLSNIEGEVYLAPQFSDMDPVTLGVLTKGVRYDIGEPSQHTVYTARDTKKSYLWDGSKFTEIAGGESSEGTNVYVSGNTLVLGGKNGGDGGNQGSQDEPVHFNVYHVDTAEFGITEGMIEKGSDGHYTEAQYDIMYNNAVGFTRAFEDAYNKGYSKISISRGDYCFTPVYNYGNSDTTGFIAPIIWILNMHDLDIDMCGSTFHLMVDSTQHSKYYKVTGSTYDYKCAIISISQARNITIRNGNFCGDIYTRTINSEYNYTTSSNEVKQEGCYGIVVGLTGFTYNINLLDLDGSGFSGDFITSLSRTMRFFKEPSWSTDLVASSSDYMIVSHPVGIAGVMNYGYYFKYDGSSIAKANNDANNKYGLSGVYDIGDRFSGSYYNGYDYVREEAANKEFSIVGYGGTYRVGNCYCPLIQVLTYSEKPESADTIPLRIIKTGYYESFQLFAKERYIRLQFLYEDGLDTGYYRASDLYGSNATDAEKLDAVNAYFGSAFESLPERDSEGKGVNGVDSRGAGPRICISQKTNGGILIEGCRIHDNGRGGISGGANDVVIRRCEFMKQQYLATSSEQGSYPVFFVDSTNYHIDYEDSPANAATIENCTFYSGKDTGKLLFKTLFNLNFRNNTCYGCQLVIGNNLRTDCSDNVFIGTALTMPDSSWLFGDSASLSKLRMTRVVNENNNRYYRCSSPGYRSLANTVHNINNCYIEIDDLKGVEFDDGSLHEVVKEFLNGDDYKNQIFDGCTIRFQTGNANPYFSYLRNCRIIGGDGWYVSRIENCDLVNSSFKIIHNLAGTDGVSAHMYIKNVHGLTLKSRCHPFLLSTLSRSDVNYQGNFLDYVVHYENCDIDVSDLTTDLLQVLALERVYRNIILEFRNCRFTGTASTTNLRVSGTYNGGTVVHGSKMIFDGCSFDLDTDYLFGGTVASSNRWFEFNDCTFSTEGFKLGSSGIANVVCGGNAGSTSSRPSLSRQGSVYFDTTGNKPVWRKSGPMTLSEIDNNGVEFVDATGTTI